MLWTSRCADRVTHSGSWAPNPALGPSDGLRQRGSRAIPRGPVGETGVEKRLAELGAVEGSTVIIGPEDNAVVFDWVPSVEHEAQVEPADGQAQEPESAEPITGEESTRRS